MKLPLILFLLAVLAGHSVASAQSETRRITRTLVNLPIAQAEPLQVYNLALRLTKLHPKLAVRYYKLGVARLPTTNGSVGANATRLALGIAKVIKKAGLSRKEIDKIVRQFVGPMCLCYGNPTPTPEPVFFP